MTAPVASRIPPLLEDMLVRALFRLQDLPGALGRSFGRKLARRLRRPSDALFAEMVARLGPGDTCLDLGANIGKVTERLAASGARVHAVEPDPENFAALAARVGHLPNVTLHHAAVGAKAGRLRMFRPVEASIRPGDHASQGVTGQFRASRSDISNSFEVEVIALDALAARAGGRIALVKMDIEGGEFEILDALVAGRMHLACEALFVETHERHYPAQWPRLREVRHAMRGRTMPVVSLYWG